ncbi:ATP-dependent Clp protease proteolytic subunit [Frankia sp. AgPm24]|uniref:ATP-dependent Clp protease proteolytic subunit n=1 Tax=Frankia sp. AgPm24 TaxID=631128 RepID=UPI002551EE63|nr:ATP-dependent Clp protease proteolytic subunit [Frankia sp. AgPm24]
MTDPSAPFRGLTVPGASHRLATAGHAASPAYQGGPAPLAASGGAIRLAGGGNPSAGLDDQVYARLLDSRIIFLGTVVEDDVANAISAKLLLLAAENPRADIWLYINSPGGSVSAGMAIYDTMQFIENDVATVTLGLAASMGQFLLCAGAPGKRYALPHARIMMHQPHGGIGGTAADISIQAEQMLYTKRVLQERTAEHSGHTAEQIAADSDRDRWFTAVEARDYGLVDHVVQRVGEVPGSHAGGIGPRRAAGHAGFESEAGAR